MFDITGISVNEFLAPKFFRALKKELVDLIKKSEMNYPIDDKLIHVHTGSIKFIDAYILKRLLYKYKPSTILEIGSFLGFSTRWLLEASHKWNAKVTAIDPNIRHRIFDNPRWFVERLNSKFYPSNLEIVSGFFGDYDDDVYYDYEHYEPQQSRDFVNQLLKEREVIHGDWSRRFDFIFIDGNHSYSATMNNFEIALELLNDGGCITFHDALSSEGVNQTLKELEIKYRGKAKVKIYGARFKDKHFINKRNDGIGFFQLKTSRE